MNIVQKAARAAIERHGGATKAARALRINVTVLRLLADCKRENANFKTMQRLGLKLVPVEAEGATDVNG